MAISVNPLLKGISGGINRQIVVKQYAHCTVITKFPDMSRVVQSPLQKKRNEVFADAVKYAQNILKDSDKYIEYKKSLQPGERVYNHAIKAYIASVKEGNIKPGNTEDEIRSKPINTEDERRNSPINAVYWRSKPVLNKNILPGQAILTRRRWCELLAFKINSKLN